MKQPHYLTITGWAQQIDSLLPFAEKVAGDASPKISVLDYVPMHGMDDVAVNVRQHYADVDVDVVVAWSLGAQMTLRLVEAGALRPKALVLIAPAYQYVSGGEVQDGTSILAYKTFRHMFSVMPHQALKRFSKLAALYEKNAEAIFATKDEDPSRHNDWLRWLDELGRFSFVGKDLSMAPRTLLIHGDKDSVTPVEQSRHFQAAIGKDKAEFLQIPNCGHAPHLQEGEALVEDVRKWLAAGE